MKDREPRNIANTGTWAFDKIAEHMAQAPEPISRAGQGDGVGFRATRADGDNARSIDLFSADGQVVISSPDVDIFFRNAAAVPAKDGIRIDTLDGQARGLFLRNGHVAVELLPYHPLEPRESPVIGQETATSSDGADMPEEWRVPPPSAPEGTSETAPTQERQPRIKVTGFVATEPNMKPTPQGLPRVQFLVAEHPIVPEEEEEQTIYHRVYTLNKTAERVRDKGGLEKGKKVQVDGYVQKRTRQNAKGEAEDYTVIYANNVRVLFDGTFTPKPPLGRKPAPKE